MPVEVLRWTHKFLGAVDEDLGLAATDHPRRLDSSWNRKAVQNAKSLDRMVRVLSSSNL